MTSFDLITSLKTLSPYAVIFWGTELGLQPMNVGVGTVQLWGHAVSLQESMGSASRMILSLHSYSLFIKLLLQASAFLILILCLSDL